MQTFEEEKSTEYETTNQGGKHESNKTDCVGAHGRIGHGSGSVNLRRRR